MPKIKYLEKKIGPGRLAIIQRANSIIAEYLAQGFQLTLRQLYYQFVSRALLTNTDKSYALLGDIINDGRLAGLIDWLAIVDRTRNLMSVKHWAGPAKAIEELAGQFRINKWLGQPYRPEVWIEKDALVGVIEGVCSQLDVPYFSCRGYTSQSEMWAASRRLRKYIKRGQTPVILHLGDHDPSGKDMTRDIRERLELFTGGKVKINRLALNYSQIEQYHPPPNPAKVTDSRAAAYIAEFGSSSWELDALEPIVLVNLVRTAILSVRDEKAWQFKIGREQEHRSLLKKTSDKWDAVVQSIAGP